MLKAKKIMIGSSCGDTIREFSLYRWDCKSIKDVPRKEYDHAMDDIRYFVSSLPGDGDREFFALSVERNERRY